jgi:DNA-binding transcriptional ArsR family regulator
VRTERASSVCPWQAPFYSNRASIDSIVGDISVCAWPKALVQVDMHLWDKSPAIILELLLSSTAHKFHFSEIVDGTTLARATVSSVLQKLQHAEVVIREEERFRFDSPFRAPRVYYTVNPLLIDHLRLHAPST